MKSSLLPLLLAGLATASPYYNPYTTATSTTKAALPTTTSTKASTTTGPDLYPTVTVGDRGCTTTSTTHKPFSACVFDKTSTRYPSTVTQTQSVGCNGCSAIVVVTRPQFHCPVEVFTKTVEAKAPTTVIETVCKVSPVKDPK